MEDLTTFADAIDRLIKAIEERNKAFAQLGIIAKMQKYSQPRKSYVSPYAKFDKFRKKRK